MTSLWNPFFRIVPFLGFWKYGGSVGQEVERRVKPDGAMLNAADDDGQVKRAWAGIRGVFHELRSKGWSRFDPSAAKVLIFRFENSWCRSLVPIERVVKF